MTAPPRPRHRPPPVPGGAPVTSGTRDELRDLRAGGKSVRLLATALGVTPGAVRRILSGRPQDVTTGQMRRVHVLHAALMAPPPPLPPVPAIRPVPLPSHRHAPALVENRSPRFGDMCAAFETGPSWEAWREMRAEAEWEQRQTTRQPAVPIRRRQRATTSARGRAA